MTEAPALNALLSEATRVAFEAAWKSGSDIVLTDPKISEDGIEYTAELYDPFSGTARGTYLFEWPDIAEVIKTPRDLSWIHETVSAWIVETGEEYGSGEFVVGEDGRVHARSDLEDDW